MNKGYITDFNRECKKINGNEAAIAIGFNFKPPFRSLDINVNNRTRSSFINFVRKFYSWLHNILIKSSGRGTGILVGIILGYFFFASFKAFSPVNTFPAQTIICLPAYLLTNFSKGKYMPNRIKESNLKMLSAERRDKQKKRYKMRFMKALIGFLVIGLVLVFRHNIIQLRLISVKPKATVIGKGVFIQTYGRCKPRVKVVFNLPECRFISKTGKGYLVKIPKLKTSLEIITFRAKTTIVGKNIFVQSLKRCRPQFKLSIL